MANESLQLFEATGTAFIEGNHRYSLSRVWDNKLPSVMFIGVNPSRADAVYNDATIIRCINFAKTWGYGSLWFGNLYSYRTPYPSELVKNIATAYNQETEAELEKMIIRCDRIICAWGSWAFIKERSKEVLAMVMQHKAPYCLGVNQDGQPKHPLYLAKNTQMMLYV